MPSNNRPDSLRRDAEDDGESLGFRLLAALVAVPVFELSLFLGLYAVSGPRRSGYLFFFVPLWFHVVYVAIAVAVGLVFGFSGLIWLLGHLFYTHFEHERKLSVTAALWLGILALVGLAYRMTA